MDLFTLQSKICNSSKDIEIFRDLLLATDKYNELRINISKFSEKNKYSRSKVMSIIKKSVDVELMHRLERGVYAVNPFVFQSIGSNNGTIEQCQSQWKYENSDNN